MATTRKVNIVFFLLMLIFYLGVAIVANAYLWFILILTSLLGLFFLQDYLFAKIRSRVLLKFYPLLFIFLFIFATETSRDYIADHPQSIEVYYNQIFDEDQVRIQYGIYNNVGLAVIDRKLDSADLTMTPTGYELASPLDPQIDLIMWIYMVFGVPLYITSIIDILGETRTVSSNNKTGGRESFISVLRASSNHIGSQSSRASHVDTQESFIQEKAKKDMFDDYFKNQRKQDNES
jgi:hypothetical protein